MLLYHGSLFDFDVPLLSRSRGHRDFGNGLYLAEEEIDSLGCCFKGNSRYGFLYVFEIDEDEVLSRPDVVEFVEPDMDWLRMIYDCRMAGRPSSGNPSIIVGPTAGHRVNELFRSYRRRCVPFAECVDELRENIVTDKFGFQWCLRTQEMVDGLRLVNKELVPRG